MATVNYEKRRLIINLLEERRRCKKVIKENKHVVSNEKEEVVGAPDDMVANEFREKPVIRGRNYDRRGKRLFIGLTCERETGRNIT